MNWNQFQAILWLRWRLSWNRFIRAGNLNVVVSVIVLSALLIGGLAAAAGGVAVGMFALARQSAQVHLLVWDAIVLGFLMFWLAGLMAEIQRAESIDLAKLMHLPVTLQQVFVFNYLASHFTPAILLLVPGMLGLSVGLVLGGNGRMALLIPLVMAFVFMLSAWTYCLRGWLSALMINKRRRRAVVVWITLGFVLLFQLPGFIVNSTLAYKRHSRPPAETASDTESPARRARSQGSTLPENFVAGHLVVPFGWPGYGAMSLQQRSALPAVGATVLSCLLGSLGLVRSYRATLKFYAGADESVPARRNRQAASSKPAGVPFMERRLPCLRDDTSALALALFRSLLRAPELKMALIMPIVAGAALSTAAFGHARHNVPPELSAFIAPAAALLGAFSFAPIMANVFGLDRSGFRGLVLLPTRRDQVLLAKNLAFLPMVSVVGLVVLVLASFVLRISLDVFITGLADILMVFLLFSLTCNLISILTPYRLATGTLQAKKPKPVVFLAVGLTMLGMPLVLWPVAIPSVLQLLSSFIGIPTWMPINVVAALVLLAGVAWVYWALLPAQGRLLQHREQRILAEVTEEVE